MGECLGAVWRRLPAIGETLWVALAPRRSGRLGGAEGGSGRFHGFRGEPAADEKILFEGADPKSPMEINGKHFEGIGDCN